MKRLHPSCLAATLLVFALCTQVGAFASSESTDSGKLARAYAGFAQKAGAEKSALDVGAANRKSVSAAWEQYQKKIGEPATAWAKTEVRYAGGSTVFYPFSGPDLVTVATLYPGARRYVLVAIQGARAPFDPGSLPDSRRQAFFDKFAGEWQKFSRLGFFRTDDLDDDAQDKRLRIGVTPILMAFATRLGYEVVGATPIALDADSGDYAAVGSDKGAAWNSVRLTLMRDGKEVTVDYVRLDLGDFYLLSHERQREWITRMAQNPVLLKAASHLLQKPGFSLLRDAIVAASPMVVQDETGLNYDALTRIGPVSLYGRFVAPHILFNRDAQKSLAEAYRKAAKTDPLPFAFGYNKSADRRSLQIVRRQSGN